MNLSDMFQGNAHFRAGEYLKAIVEYDAAIMIHGSNTAYPSNMAAARHKLEVLFQHTTMRRLLPERSSFSTPASRYRRGLARKGNLELARAAVARHTRRFTSSPLPLARSHMPSSPAVEEAPSWLSQGAADYTLDNAMLPSAELTTQCDKANGTPATAAAEAAAMRCTTTRHDDRMEHAHVHASPLSTTGWSTLTPPSPAFLPHAPAYDDLERSIIPLFVASSSSLLGLSVASSLSSCPTEDLGTAAVVTTPHGHMAENSTLDSLTGDSQMSCPWVGDV
ncbi:hypothetical protein F5148DRAFT_1288276 [Russula earlei]|uniref:Uncharacterized protein n=1 Tax=Russula earlei TaxID=71964 RepID=A0ACC0TZX1_9AGAM|nr:hypothetical protein F5148DRAFT_1288276 [Russula earlei]